jgi:hypothetical protein
MLLRQPGAPQLLRTTLNPSKRPRKIGNTDKRVLFYSLRESMARAANVAAMRSPDTQRLDDVQTGIVNRTVGRPSRTAGKGAVSIDLPLMRFVSPPAVRDGPPYSPAVLLLARKRHA